MLTCSAAFDNHLPPLVRRLTPDQRRLLRFLARALVQRTLPVIAATDRGIAQGLLWLRLVDPDLRLTTLGAAVLLVLEDRDAD